MTTASDVARWKRDPVAFVEEVLIDPEVKKPFRLYEGERDLVSRGFTLTSDGRLPFAETIFAGGKKSGKTGLGACCGIYVAAVIGGPFAEVYCLANDYEQASSRVFQACVRIITASPLLKNSVRITKDRIVFTATGSFIQAVASDYQGFAGSNPSLSICDELWGFTSEASERLFDEATPSPVRKVSGRLVVTYAGFSGESQLLERLYNRGMEGTEVAPFLYESEGMLMRWAHGPDTYRGVPWITPKWIEESRKSLRPNQFLRMIHNEWVTTESAFIEMEDFDRCVDPARRPLAGEELLPVWVGVDASVKRDATGVAVVTYDYKTQKVVLVDHKILTPRKDEPVNFAALEDYLLGLRRRFAVRMVAFDPYQFASTEQRLSVLGLPMEPFVQSLPNLEQASSNLYDLFRYQRIALYPDAAIRMAMSHTVAVETPKGGTRISKSRASHHIDIIAALSFACLMAIKEGGYKWTPGWIPASAAPPVASSSRYAGGGEPDRLWCSGEDYAAWEDAQSARATIRRTAYSGKYKGCFGD